MTHLALVPVPPVAHLDGVSQHYGKTVALNNITLDIPARCMVGLIGPDGVGKSSLLSLISGARVIEHGNVMVLGGDMRDPKHRRDVCPRIAWMPQGLGKNLYHTLSVYENVDFFARLFGHDKAEREARITELLNSTGLAPFRDRPAGKLSGGMKQKLGLCCALIHDPELLILDEPTTGVDPLSRAQFWDLINSIRQRQTNMSVLVATAYMEEAERFDWLVAMNAGEGLATGSAQQLREQTNSNTLEQAFIALLPEAQRQAHKPVVIPPYHAEQEEIAIEAKDLTMRFGKFVAVDHVNFRIPRGEIFGFLGSNGCGKSTTGRTILRLAGEKTGGQVLFNGKEVYDMTGRELRNLRTKMQIIFQDPFSSLSPRLPVGEIIGEAVREHNLVPKAEFNDYIDQVMDNCGLQPYHKTRYPHEFSGGQRQRIGIARALALNPEFVVCDEPVSALDVSIQAQIINLLKELQDKYNLTYLFISHDLSVVEHISDTVGVMYLGNLVEYGATPDIFSHPLHPYTKALFSAIPIPDPTIRRERIVLQGSIPSPANPPKGCKFHTRCPYATERCKTEAPQQREVEPGHYVVCHLYEK